MHVLCWVDVRFLADVVMLWSLMVSVRQPLQCIVHMTKLLFKLLSDEYNIFVYHMDNILKTKMNLK